MVSDSAPPLMVTQVFGAMALVLEKLAPFRMPAVVNVGGGLDAAEQAVGC